MNTAADTTGGGVATVPIKHLAASYRNRNGVAFKCWTDCNHDEAPRIVAELRADGRKAFAEHNRREGYSRVFREVKHGDPK